MTETQALKVLRRYTTNADLIKHVKMVCACMKHFAKLAGEDVQRWAVIAILHGLVYEMFYDTPGQPSAEIFKLEGFDAAQIHAFQAHGYQSLTDIKPDTYMELCFVVVDQLCGFLFNHPNADIATVKRMFANKDFAIGTQRIMQNVEKMNKPLDWVIAETLAALKKIKKVLFPLLLYISYKP